MNWTELPPEAKAAEVESRRRKGHSYRQMSNDLGTSREAIAGVAHRHNITAPTDLRGGAVKAIQDKALKARQDPDAPIPPSQPADKLLLSPVWNALPDSTPKPLDLTKGCTWPIGIDHPFGFCDQPTAEGKPYCPAHCAIAYKPAPPPVFRGKKTR